MKSSMSFEKAFRHIIELEGGYVNHPDDPGGETKWGISKRAFPDFDIKNLTQEEARAIYYENYWTKVRGDELPSLLKLPVFDGAVNHGVGRSIRFLQKALGVKVDGDFGPNTMRAVRSAWTQEIMIRYMTRRAMFYNKLPTFKAFGEGWTRRLLVVTRAAE